MTDDEYERTWKYRSSMFTWKLRCAWCDVKTAFKYLTGTMEKPEALEADYPGSLL